jgi:hypothetical protein
MRCSKALALYAAIGPAVPKSRAHSEAVGAYQAHMAQCMICSDHNHRLVEWARLHGLAQPVHEEPIEVTDELKQHQQISA